MPEFDAPRGQRQVGDNGRLARQWGALTSDLRAWIELRVALIEAQLTERVRRELLYRGVQGMMYVAAGMFLLAGGAWGLGEVFGHPAYGFAVIGGVMGACASIVHWVRNSRRKTTGSWTRTANVAAPRRCSIC